MEDGHPVVKESCFVVAKMASRWGRGRCLFPLFHSFCVVGNGNKGGDFRDSGRAAIFFKECLQFPTHRNSKIRNAGTVDNGGCFSRQTIVPNQIVEFTMTKRSIFGLTEPIAVILKEFLFNSVTVEKGRVQHGRLVGFCHFNQVVRKEDAIKIAETSSDLCVFYSRGDKKF